MIASKSKNSDYLKQMRELIIRLLQANRINEKLEEKAWTTSIPKCAIEVEKP